MIIGVVIAVLILGIVLYAGYNSPRMSPELGLDVSGLRETGTIFGDSSDDVFEVRRGVLVDDSSNECRLLNRNTLSCPYFTIECVGGEWYHDTESNVWTNRDGLCDLTPS